MAQEARFGHREHLELSVDCVQRLGASEGLDAVRDAIRHVATAHGQPDKYHETLTQFWTRLTAHALAVTGAHDADELLAAHPQLLERDLAERHWSRELLFSAEARAGWVEPDLRPLPAST